MSINYKFNVGQLIRILIKEYDTDAEADAVGRIVDRFCDPNDVRPRNDYRVFVPGKGYFYFEENELKRYVD